MITDFNDFLLENNNQTEYIDFKKTNMEEDFNFINNLMFDNKVLPTELGWFKNKSKIGIYYTGDNSIKISTFYKMTRKQYLETLAHEMIHAFITQQNIRDNGDHGREFNKIMNELNRKHNDFNITPTEDAAYFSVNSNIKKSIGVVLVIYNGGEDINTDFEAIYVNKQVINNKDMLNKFVDDMLKFANNTHIPNNPFNKYKSISLEFYKCDNPELSKFKLKRNLNLTGLGLYGVNEGELRKIREGELFNTIKLK